ncbi:MAG: hypothetical protein K0U86_06715 [Planctomycetes bacterium]|nr:hypothetical protein [Planctomycetota bacterium]MCH9724580.1 hypothetical protein [Planctomycetota bacterium]MCH9777868.1 hypothetical protein [Planctomycetota bacterium]MCH9793043.1 hypothetical protein [Planctomycetota bacterium]
MNLQQEIANWNGRSVDDLEEIYERYVAETGVGSELVRLLKEPSLQRGASWLLKRFLEEGQAGAISSDDLKGVFESLSGLEDWESELHLLQSLPCLTIGKRNAKRVESFLRDCVVRENKFVRAWAYNGFHELALQHPKYQAEVDQLLE